MEKQNIFAKCCFYNIACFVSEDKYYRGTRRGLTEIPDDIPNDVQEVFLGSNDITEIKANAFSNLAKFTHLYLGRNEISRIEAGASEGLDNLKYLDLRNNSLESLGLEVLDDLPRPLELDLEGNVFDCDSNSVGCHLRKEEDEKTITFVSEPSCTDGRTLFLNAYTCGGKCYLFISATGRVSRLSLSFGNSFLLWLTIYVYIANFYRPQRSWGKVRFSEACVKNSVHMGRGCTWHGACVAGGGRAWHTVNERAVGILLEYILV